MQKNDGTFELAIWGEQVRGANKITVNLGAPYKTVRVYDPTISARPIETLEENKNGAADRERPRLNYRI